MVSRFPPPPPDPALANWALVLLFAAAVGTLFSFTAFGLCEEGCDERLGELVGQLIAALLGLAAAVTMAYFAAGGRRRAAGLSLTVTLLLYAVWAVLLDAATHGWGSGPVPL